MRAQEDLCDISFVRILGVVIFALFYCLLNLNCGECHVLSVYVLCCSVNGSVGFVCCVSDSVWELVGETIRNMFGCP